MKKFFFTLLIIFLTVKSSFAGCDCNSIKFIYLNGANSNNETEKKNFTYDVQKIQREIKKTFENDSFIQYHLLDNGKYNIDENPEVMFWGLMPAKEVNSTNRILLSSKKSSPFLAQSLRSYLFHSMHDLFWLQRQENMQATIDALHKSIIKTHQNGQKIVLAGHSAGSLITYEYLLHKLKYFNTDILTGKNQNKYTCIDAILKSKLAYRLALYDELLKNPNEQEFKKAFARLDKDTQDLCTPDNTIAGVMNFGSPLELFFSCYLKTGTDCINEYQKPFIEYLIKNNIFLLTVNFANDPLSLSVAKNPTKISLERKLDTEFEDENNGFIYNYSKEKSLSPLFTAHFAYWIHPKKFSKTAKNAYKKGYKYFNCE